MENDKVEERYQRHISYLKHIYANSPDILVKILKDLRTHRLA